MNRTIYKHQLRKAGMLKFSVMMALVMAAWLAVVALIML